MPKSGFTLVELLVVVAILSAIAATAFSLVTDGRIATARIDDTLARLTTLRRAILGLESPAWDGAVRLSGFVADNGRLPESVSELVERPAGFAEQKSVMPRFSATVGPDCVQTGATPISATDVSLMLTKGHRGNYLAGIAHNEGSTPVFRDGWGNRSTADPANPDADKKNFGWLFTQSTTPDSNLIITSLGANNQIGVTSTVPENEDAETDRSTVVAPGDWQTANLNAWRVTLKVPTPLAGTSVTLTGAPASGKFSVALLVFRNTDDVGRQWMQFNSQKGCGDSSDWDENGTCTLIFDVNTACGGNPASAPFPLGRHLLLLLRENGDGGIDKIYAYKRGTEPAPDRYASATPAFFPGTLPPPVTLEIR